MTVKDPLKPAPTLPPRTKKVLTSLDIQDASIAKALARLNTSKAVGPDGVSPHTLRHCSKELAPVLGTIFRRCLLQGVWPRLWKVAKIVPAHKKSTKTLPKNYRPISLLPILGKVFEELLVSSI